MTETQRLIQDLARFCTQTPPAGSLPFILNGRTCGLIVPASLERLRASPFAGRFCFTPHSVALTTGPDADAELAELARGMHAAELFFQWRDELLDITDAEGSVIARAERGLFRLLGLTTRAVYAVGMTAEGRIWCGLRSRTKQIDPGLWDVLAAGLVASGETIDESMAREMQEEAGLEAGRDATPAGEIVRITVLRNVEEGWMHEEAHCRAFVVHASAHVHNVDGEVEAYECITREDMIARIRGGMVPADTAWAMLLCCLNSDREENSE